MEQLQKRIEEKFNMYNLKPYLHERGNLNKIDRYLRGEMTDREKNAFENILAGDDNLRQRVGVNERYCR